METNANSMFTRFFNKLAFKEASDQTVTTYRFHLNKLRLFLTAQFGVDPDSETGIRDVTGGMLEEFQITLKEQGAKPATQQLSCAVARAYFNWAFKAGLVDKNPADALTNVKVVREEQSHLSWPQVEQLMGTYHSRNQLRDVTLMAIGFTMGIRVGGILGLNIGDIHEDGTLTYRNKGGARVTAFIPEPVMNLIDEYIRKERAYADPDEPLFVSATGARLSVDTVEVIYKKAGNMLGIHITPHSARRTCLSRINELQGREMAQVVAHHSDARTTSRYLYESREAMADLYRGMSLFRGTSDSAIADVLADAED